MTPTDETYLDRIRRCGRDANPFFRMLGVDVESLEDGKACLSLVVRPEMRNGEGWLQGGLFTALADEAMALALYTRIEREEEIATITESTSFLKGVREGTILACGWMVRRGRRVAFLEGEVRKEDRNGEVLARSTASFLILGRDTR